MLLAVIKANMANGKPGATNKDIISAAKVSEHYLIRHANFGNVVFYAFYIFCS